MIDHVSLAVRDLAGSSRFYEHALAPLGFRRLVNSPDRVAFGTSYPELWLNARPHMDPIAVDTGAHLCLRTRTTRAVSDFHAAALAHGGTDDGAPGLRKVTQVTYFAAFVRDLDGNRLEVMTVPATA